MAEQYDLVVIGSGPGGYVAAVRAAQLGFKTACVEKDERLGGVCLNVGCIPSKALLDSSEFYHLAKERLAVHGVRVGEVSLDLAAMMARKEKVVKDLTDNLRKLLDGNGVTVIRGEARLAGATRVEVKPAGEAGGGPLSLEARFILLATGSEPVAVPGLPFDGRRLVDSTGALTFTEVPKRLGVVGGGYIGLELGSIWRRLGSAVTVIEMMPQIAGVLDGQVSRTLERILRKQGFQLALNARVLKAETDGDGVNLTWESGGKEHRGVFDKVLVAVGRRPLTRNLGLEDAGVTVDPTTGRVIVDASFRTEIPSVYAIGDLIPGPMLAHKASAEGIAAVEAMAGFPSEVNYEAIPSVIYTFPEVASVGLTEEQAREQNISYCVGTYPFTGVGRARCMGETEGFVKVLSHSRTDRLLGVHILGPRASDMIAECVLAMEFGAAAEDIARAVHGHPTFSEALQEAAKVAWECAISRV